MEMTDLEQMAKKLGEDVAVQFMKEQHEFAKAAYIAGKDCYTLRFNNWDETCDKYACKDYSRLVIDSFNR